MYGFAIDEPYMMTTVAQIESVTIFIVYHQKLNTR